MLCKPKRLAMIFTIIKQGIDADTLKIWLKEIGQDTVLNKKERLGASFQKKNKIVL